MKYLKMIGLAAVAAMALMAFFGASSASAGVLCKTDVDPCGEWDMKVNETMTASLTPGTHATLNGAFADVTCKKSHIAGKIEDTGGKEKNVKGTVTELNFQECTCEGGRRVTHVTVTVDASGHSGTLEINDSTEVFGRNNTATVNCTGLAKCEFGTTNAGTKVGTFTESNTANPPTTAEVDANATLTFFPHEGGSSQFLCAGFGDTAKWEATYQVTSPDALWHSAS